MMVDHNHIRGLHHVTAIASGAQANIDFYTRVLGLRLVKRTINFDAPDTYHFYYGDSGGSPGSLLTFSHSRTRQPAASVPAWPRRRPSPFPRPRWRHGCPVLPKRGSTSRVP